MPTDEDESSDQTRITFRIPQAKKDEFERVINGVNFHGIRDTSASELLRESVDYWIETLGEEIEEPQEADEGNPKLAAAVE